MFVDLLKELEISGYPCSSYTYAQNSNSVADELSISIPVSGDQSTPRFNIGSVHAKRIGGKNVRGTLISQETTPTEITLKFIVSDKNLHLKAANKDIRFICMTSREYQEFMTYITRINLPLGLLSYHPLIRIISYDYSTIPVKIVNAWKTHNIGLNKSGDTIAGNVASLIGIPIYINLPPYKVTNFSIQKEEPILSGFLSLVNPFEPTVFIKNGTIFITSKNRTYSFGSSIRIKEATSVSETESVDVDYENLTIRGSSSAPINPLFYEGEIIIKPNIRSIAVITEWGQSFGGISHACFGNPIVEESVSEVTDDKWGVINRTKKKTESGYDPFLVSKHTFFEQTETYELDISKGQLILADRVKTYTRYLNLGIQYQSPRIESPSLGSTSTIDFTINDIDRVVPVYFTNWATMSLHGFLALNWNTQTGTPEVSFFDDLELSFKWIYYNSRGHISYELELEICPVWTPAIIPVLYSEFQTLEIDKDSLMGIFPLSEIKPFEQHAGGTVVPLLVNGFPNWKYNRLLWKKYEETRYAAISSDMYRKSTIRRALNKQYNKFEYVATHETVSAASLSTVSKSPREANLVIKDTHSLYKPIRILDKPTKVVSFPDMVEVDNPTLFLDTMKKMHGVGPDGKIKNIARVYTFPFPYIVDKGTRVYFDSAKNYANNSVIPARSGYGVVKSCTINHSPEGATTSIVVEGVPK